MLLGAILQGAILDLKEESVDYYNCSPQMNRRMAESARRWVNSENSGTASYLWICEHLDVNQNFIRRAANSGSIQKWRRPKALKGVDTWYPVVPGFQI